jgi:phosphoenolpyruvate-protein phosphotransferase (PTS system enzyme I)
MPEPLRLKGLPASAGFAAGPIWRPPLVTQALYHRQDSQAAEISALDAAIAKAVAQTQALVAAASGEAADILEFQQAMLEDNNFRAASLALVETGIAADEAWLAALDTEIEGYSTSEDEYFRARASDLADIRDRVLAALTGAAAQQIPHGAIYFADDIAPSLFLAHDWQGGGLALKHGSSTGHVAILARQRAIPVIVGLGEMRNPAGSFALLDAVSGEIVLDPGEAEFRAFEAARHSHGHILAASQQFADKPAITASGERVQVMVNIADPAEINSIDVAQVDGIGLMRTEFLFGDGLPGEDAQYTAYCTVLEWAQGRPVTIRTIDAGGDKPVAGLTEVEQNPFLGMRGIRLSLAKPEIFAVQIRALLRAAVHGNLKVMLPMVAVPGELDEALALFELEAAALERAGVPHAMPPVGIMVEVPSVAVLPERFGRAAFFSIGSNDLTQYVLAASRDNWKLAELARADDPAVLALIERVAQCGADTGREVSLCGDAASNPQFVPHLLTAGLRTLSVAASSIGMVKAAVAGWPGKAG